MSIEIILLLGVALALDSFAVAMGMGLAAFPRRRFAAFVAIVILMHIFFPLVGLAIGDVSAAYIGRAAAYLGGALLIFLAARCLWPALRRQEREAEEALSLIPGEGLWPLLAVALSVSMDALSVGFSLGVVDFVWYAPVLIGAAAGVFTLAGYGIGRVAGLRFKSWSELLAGVILLVIGLKILIGA